MDNGGRESPAHDHNRKELSISLAASSMINASDMITQQVYQANLRRIQEVKEMVRRLETNNEAAHKNFLIGQLEKRAKEGREAEDMLVQLRNEPGLSETVQFTNNVPSGKSEVILPTTATLVEVPESHSYSSYSSPPPTTTPHSSQTAQRGRPASYQWSVPPPAHQAQSSNPDVSRRYMPPPTVRQSTQHNAVPHSEAPVNPAYTTQSVPPQSRPSQSWGSYPHPVIVLPPSDIVSVPGYYTSSAGWARTAPVHGGSNTGSPSPTHFEPGFTTRSTVPRPPVTTYDQPQNPLSLASISQLQVPLQNLTAGPAKTPSGQPPPARSHPTPAEFQPQPIPTTVSNPVAIPELQRLHKQPQQSQVQLPSQRSLRPPQMHSQLSPQPADRIPSTVFQPQDQYSQPTIAQEQVRQRGSQPRIDQAMFIRLFQRALQSGILQLKAFWFHAKASGISNEWLTAAINSLPPDAWQSVLAQVNQSGPILDPPPLENGPWQQVSTTPSPNVPAASARPPLTAAPLVQTLRAAQQAPISSTSTEGNVTHAASMQASGPYIAQLQYYAEQAAKSALFTTQAASIPTVPPANIAPRQTPKRDVPQAQANARTPGDSNKSTLARDILRSLGKTVPEPHQEMGGKPTEKANGHEGDQLPGIASSQPVSHVASPKLRARSMSSFADTNLPSAPCAKPDIQDEPQPVTFPSPSTAQPQDAVIEGPIMIDLTLEDSDESVHGKGQDPTFSIRTSASATTSSRPMSPTNTTNHTPLFKNLSLEEPPVDAATDIGNADAHMHSPPLSLAAEGDMDSELLYPRLGSAEPVLPNFEQLPREASEHRLDGQLPLFLPSPPVSPVHTEPSETDLEVVNDEGESGPSLKRRSVDVDVMEIDTQLVTPPHAKKRRKQRVYVLIPSAPFDVKKAIKKMKERSTRGGINSDLVAAGEDEELQYSHLEQLLIEESKSRLLERRCQWSNCAAILSCAANLFAHLKSHAREEDSQDPFLCRWVSCQRRFGMEHDRDVHLERHTIRPLPCPFSGCDEQFDKPVEVMQHEVQHQKADRREPLIRKPTCQPMVPAIPSRLGPPPQWLPSHRVIPRRLVKCRISADRHGIVGPWVLWNIFSPIDLNVRKQNASMRYRPARQSINYDLDNADPRRDDYDFLLAPSSHSAKNPQLDDLDSTVITMSAARGLTLWGSETTVNSAGGSTSPEEHMDVVSVTLAMETTVPSSVTKEVKGNVGEERQMVIGEEDAVERLLIL